MTDMPPAPDWVLNLLAGVIGGAVRAITQPAQGWMHRIVTSLVGGAVAVYMTPIVAPLVQAHIGGGAANYGAAAGFAGFLLGMSGLAAAELGIKMLRRLTSGDNTGGN